MFMNNFLPRNIPDLLAEFADQVHAALSIENLRSKTKEHILQLAVEPQTQELEMNSATGGRIETLNPKDPEMWFIKLVEGALRKFPDYIMLGGSPLAGHVGVKGETQIARGKQLQQLLQDAIEALRPDGRRPAEPLPRAWHNYAVLYDAYVEGVPNREVMARLHISEGTFNRTRRNALRGVARLLIEGTSQRSNNI